MKTKITILIAALSLISCGSKKTVSQSNIKEKTDIELTDNSKINTKVEQGKQYINTGTKERIVTFYGMQLIPYPVDGDTVYLPVSYPVKKEEDREISEQIETWRISVQDSIQNAIELKYENDLKEKDKKISELKESTQALQISILVGSIAVLALILTFIFGRNKK